MKKVFGFIALAITLIACDKFENNNLPAEDNGQITITAQLAPKTTLSKAISDQTTYLKVDWAVDEHIAILYEVSSTKYAADATITAVDGTGAATITFAVEAGTAEDTPCTLVYPLSAAKDDHSGVKDAATLLAAQDGTLNANLDVRVGSGTIQVATPGLTVTTQPAAQFAIFKFTTKNADGSATIDVRPLTVTIGSQNYVITPAGETSELWAALPAVSSKTVSFSATGGINLYSCSKDGITFTAGNYYPSTLKMKAAVVLSALTANYEAQNGDILTGTLTGSTQPYQVSIADGATVILQDATINGDNNGSCLWAGITCAGDATIILNGTNIVKGFHENHPGIQVASGKTLIIRGAGSLTASTFDDGSYDSYGAGIGGARDINCGNIEIQGGNVTAKGGLYAAGIGGGGCDSVGSNCGTITISGGTVVATSATMGCGIGCGWAGDCGIITISDGNVTATGGYAGPGIGSTGNCSGITISGGTVTATGGNAASGIGTTNTPSVCGDITISGGTVEAIGKGYCAGIGCGSTFFSDGGTCGAITITTGVTSVSATKGEDALYSIGNAAGGTCGTVTIGGVVTGDIATSPYTYPAP